MGNQSAKEHTFEEIVDNPPDRNAISGYKTLKLIDLIKGCLHPEALHRAGPIYDGSGYWVQYTIPHEEVGGLVITIFYCSGSRILQDIYTTIFGTAENVIPNGPFKEVVLGEIADDSNGTVAVDIKHIVVDGQHLNIMYVIGRGWQLDPLDRRTAKVVMLLLGLYQLDFYQWPLFWANYSMGRLITDILDSSDRNLEIPITEGLIERMRHFARYAASKLGDIEPIISLEEILE